MKRALILALLLAGCAGKTPPAVPEPVIRTVTVYVPTTKPCVPPTLMAPPDYPDTDAALQRAVDAADRFLLLVGGRTLRSARLAELEGVVAGCRK